MRASTSRQIVETLLEPANIKINGQNPWDLQVHDDRLYDRVLKYANLGLGESYMEGWWDCERIDELIFRALNANLDQQVIANKRFWFTLLSLKLRALPYLLMNAQTRSRSLEVGRKHYDVGNELYQLMLDKNLNYSCGYWKDAQTLDEAQVAKLDLTCRKLQLEPGMRLLDVGCGFGALAHHAAKHFGVSVVGVTISRQQELLAKERCKGLPITIRFQDYRDITEQFDRVASIGMFEHVGSKNYKTFMKVIDRCMASDGIFLLHTIGSMESSTHVDPWTGRYIFPNSVLPSMTQIGSSLENTFVIEDWHCFGLHYVKTLRAWHHNFTTNWPQIKDQYSEQFYRMWVYYLLSSAGGFMAKSNQLWQLVLTKKSRSKEYVSVR
jgi:cyclopropane-fatty-acyl-phospholipid synthase